MATLRDTAPCPAQACPLQPLGGSSFCLPGGQLPLFPALPAPLRTLSCFCHLSPPGAICHPVFRQSWGRGEEKANRSQMEQVGNSRPERQVVPGLPAGIWVVPTSLGMGVNRSGKVWVWGGYPTLSLGLSMYEQWGLSGCISVWICVSGYFYPKPGLSLGIPAHLPVSLLTVSLCLSTCLYLPCLSHSLCILVWLCLSVLN